VAALLGDEASGLSPTAITRLTAAWKVDYEAFRKREPLESVRRDGLRVPSAPSLGYASFQMDKDLR
jgi:hypothetical protein